MIVLLPARLANRRAQRIAFAKSLGVSSVANGVVFIVFRVQLADREMLNRESHRQSVINFSF